MTTLIKFRLVPYPDDHDYDFLTIVIVILGRVGVFTRGRSGADRFHACTVACLCNLGLKRTHPLIALMMILLYGHDGVVAQSIVNLSLTTYFALGKSSSPSHWHLLQS